ncbi:MAG: hypothetical protein HQK89_12065 [Nitrospirae bacterium]|nr:hypothetical protein [Nitrospirota bacterium]
MILPTLPEVLRMKAFLCPEGNANRDYLDLAALAAHMGIEAAGGVWMNSTRRRAVAGGLCALN